MGASTSLSGTVLQTASDAASSAVPEGAAQLAEIETYGLDFILHAAFIWVALIIIGLIVFGYRKVSKNGKDRFPDIYEEELRAMRRGPSRHR